MFEEIITPKKQLQEEYQNFYNHLTSTISGKPSGGLSRLATKSGSFYRTNDSDVQLIIIGGTKTSSCEYSYETKLFENRISIATPTLTGAEVLKDLILSINASKSTIVLNFAFPIKPNIRDKKLDGKLLRGTKQHTLSRLIDKNIGEYIESFLPRETNVIVTNDITALLYGFEEKQIFLAGIIGTGSNFGLRYRGEVINLETGNFEDFLPSQSTKYIDNISNNKGEQLWEKSISGKYLKDHFNYWANVYNIPKHIESSADMNHLKNPQERELGSYVLLSSAQKTAVTMAAIGKFAKSSNFVLEGSVMWKAYGYLNHVNKTLVDLDHFEISCVESNRPFHNLSKFVRLIA